MLRVVFSKTRIGMYRSSIARNSKSKLRKIKIVKNNIQNLDFGSVIFLSEYNQKLSKCSKNGGYKKFFGHWVWVNQKIIYFPNNQRKILNYGGVPNFISEATLVCAENAEIFPNRFMDNYRQKYTFYITQNKSVINDLDQAISFNIGGANSFQHFLQDCLPVIAMSKKFLDRNPKIPILLPQPNPSFTNRDYLLKKIGITNKIIESNKIDSLRVRELYFWNFYPFNAQYSLPPIFYRELRSMISDQNSNFRKRSVVLFIRTEKMRNFRKLEQLKRFLQNFANLNNLDFEIINTSTEEIASLEKKIKRALILIAIHGGSTYNAILCQDDCTTIEFIPMRNTNSNINFLSYSGVKYLPIPGNFDFYDECVEVSIPDLELALSKLVFN
jgi:hypothetical protein